MRAYLAIPVVILAACCAPAAARDDGRYANVDPALKAWFNKLASDNGLCCSFADGVAIEDVDWDTLGSRDNGGSGYRVRLNGVWIEVPMKAVVISEDRPKNFADAVVWPFQAMNGTTQIRCFIPGTGA